jgi:hypothetical protein
MLTGFGAQLNASALNIRRVTIERILLEAILWHIFLHKNRNKDNDAFVVFHLK